MKDLGLLIAFGTDKVLSTQGKAELFLENKAKGIYNYRFTDAQSTTEIRISRQQAEAKYLMLDERGYTIYGELLK